MSYLSLLILLVVVTRQIFDGKYNINEAEEEVTGFSSTGRLCYFYGWVKTGSRKRPAGLRSSGFYFVLSILARLADFRSFRRCTRSCEAMNCMTDIEIFISLNTVEEYEVEEWRMKKFKEFVLNFIYFMHIFFFSFLFLGNDISGFRWIPLVNTVYAQVSFFRRTIQFNFFCLISFQIVVFDNFMSWLI